MPRRQPVARRVVPADPGDLSTWQRIEQAALELFAAKGFEATGIRDLAVRAGLSTSALYHYMGGKDELLVAFMVESMTELTRAAHAALEGSDDPAAQLAALVRVHVSFHTLDAQRSLVADDELRAVSDAAFTKVMQLRDGYERLWAETLERGARSGEFSFADARITRLALLECATASPAGIQTGDPSIRRRLPTASLIWPLPWSAPGWMGTPCGLPTCSASRQARSWRWWTASYAGQVPSLPTKLQTSPSRQGDQAQHQGTRRCRLDSPDH